MTAKVEERTYEDAVSWLREHGFDLIEAPGTQGRVFLRKYNCSAAIQKTDDGGVKIFAYPGYLIGSEISKLVNRGYQQFLKTSKTEVPATADHLKALHSFAEELKVALGLPSLYNESLGTVSDPSSMIASKTGINLRSTSPSGLGKWWAKRLQQKRAAPKSIVNISWARIFSQA